MNKLVGIEQQEIDSVVGNTGKSVARTKRSGRNFVEEEEDNGDRDVAIGSAPESFEQFFRADQDKDERLRGRLAALGRQLAHAKEATSPCQSSEAQWYAARVSGL